MSADDDRGPMTCQAMYDDDTADHVHACWYPGGHDDAHQCDCGVTW